MLMCIHFVTGGIVGSLRMEQIFSRITDKINLLISKWFSVHLKTAVLVLFEV